MGEATIRTASAGPAGERVRSDLNVSYEPTSDPLTVDLTSKVDYLYGEAIESAVRRVADAFAVATGQPGVGSIAAHSGFVFWTTASDLVMVELSTGTTTTLASGRSEPRGVAVDATHVYWVEGAWTAPQTVQRIPRAGGAVEPLSSGDAMDIAIDATDIYVADCRGSTIWRMPKAGGTPQTLVTGGPAAYPWDIAVDALEVFWSNEGDGAVGKVAK